MQKCYFYLVTVVGSSAFVRGMQAPWQADDLWTKLGRHHQLKRILLPGRRLRHLSAASMLPMTTSYSKLSSFIAVVDGAAWIL